MRYPPNPGGNFPPGCCWCVKKDHISTFTTPLLTTNVISALLLIFELVKLIQFFYELLYLLV